MSVEELKISNVLLSIGIFPSKAGYVFLKEAILAYKRFNGNMQSLCLEIGRSHNVSKESVERDMRTAIDDSAHKGKLGKVNEIIGIAQFEGDVRYRTKEFVSLVAEYLDMPEPDGYENDKIPVDINR